MSPSETLTPPTLEQSGADQVLHIPVAYGIIDTKSGKDLLGGT